MVPALTLAQAAELVQHQTLVLDVHRATLGALAQVYVDDDSDVPLWVAVVFDPPSPIETVVSLDGARVEAGRLVTRYPKELVEAGPRITAGDELPWVDERRLRRHYGQDTDAPAAVVVPVTDLTSST